jgi:mannose-6-phosphate isomerase-like protein (cupin superfamily)
MSRYSGVCMKQTIVILAVSLAGVLLAQGPAAPPAASMKTFASSADVTALIAKAKSERKDGQAIVIEKILQFAPYVANLEYRASAGAAAVHPAEAEMMYVIEGQATFVTGGKLTGATITGGTAQTVSKGDFLVVPEGTPHWFSAIDSTLVLMTIKMPRAATGN